MFEIPLLESEKRKQPKGRFALFPIVIAIHLLVLAGVVIAQYWEIAEMPEPSIQVSFIGAPPPPPPPPPPAPRKAQVVQKVEAPPPTTPVQPVEVPEKPPEPTNAPDSGVDFGVEGGVEGGVPGGVAGGIPGGVVGGVPGGVLQERQEEEILRPGGEVVKPVGIDQPPPAYTELARKARITGVVIVEAIIDKNGNVTNVRVLKGLPMGLDQSAVDAIKRWKFKPATLNGRPVAVYYTLTVKFSLN